MWFGRVWVSASNDRTCYSLHLRGALGGGEKILEQAVAVARSRESIRATRNLPWLFTALEEIDARLLSDLTRAILKALVQANAEKSRPPGLFKLISTFRNKDFRRGLAAFNVLLLAFGKNLIEKTPD